MDSPLCQIVSRRHSKVAASSQSPKFVISPLSRYLSDLELNRMFGYPMHKNEICLLTFPTPVMFTITLFS